MHHISLFSKAVAIITLILAFTSPVFASKPEIVGVGNGNSKKPVAIVTTARMKACQARESTIKIRMTQLTKLVTTMETTFDKIASRVMSYYTEKVLPSGRSLSNYSALTDDIAAKKVLIRTALDNAKTNASTFTCTPENPKTQVTQFNTNMRLVKDALKAYRTSINKLIVAIRTIPPISPTPTPTN